MARPYVPAGRLITEPLEDENGSPTGYERVLGVTLPMAPGVQAPMSVSRVLDYRLRWDGRAWLMEVRGSGASGSASVGT